MGYGYKLNIDLPGESRGFIPNAKFYNDNIGEGKWGANTILSIAIGQGEIMATPLQIANLSATIANRGYYITPHVVKQIRDVGIPKEYTEKHQPSINREYYENVVTGMRMAVTGGTCKNANLPGLEVCGKTGTVQNPHGQDHSVFMGFAPKDDPKIAICVYVENAGFGAQVAVPLGSRIFERYLLGKSRNENDEIVSEDTVSNEIENGANKWSDKWLQERPSAFDEKEVPAQLNPDNTPKQESEKTAHHPSPSDPINGLPQNREQEQAILTRPIVDIFTRYGIYKG